jgi:hypothetical protein
VVLIGGTGAAIILAASARLGQAGVRGALLGAAISVLAAIGVMGLIARSLRQGWRAFFGAMVGGILARLLIVGIALVYVGMRAAASYDLIATATALLAFTAVFQCLEVGFVLRDLKGRAS